MLSRFSSRIMLIVAMTPLTAVLLHGQSSPVLLSQTTRNSLSNASVPVCYIQLENGQVRDLRQLCGKKSLNPVPARLAPESSVQSDADDEESKPTAASSPQTTASPRSPNSASTSQPPPTNPTPQPSAGSLVGVPGRSTSVPPSPAVPPNNPLASPGPASSPNPLAVPADDDRY